jgi:hypothetical protein
MNTIPNSRPQAGETLVRELLAKGGVADAVALLGVRGYYRDSLGTPGANDVGIYDDAIFLVAPVVFLAVNANTDPSRLGWNEGVGKPFAVLQPGLWFFRRGPHKGNIPALRQCTDEEAASRNIPHDGEFLVERSYGVGNAKNFRERGYFAINMHRGGVNGTSSWGCQTIPPGQFDGFMNAVWAESVKVNQARLPYLLMDGPIA